MAVQKTTITDFLTLAALHPVLDVRSPAEYAQAHIPGAASLPLFTNEQRTIVGTIYKQQSREKAIKQGLDFFGPNMRNVVETAEAILRTHTGAKTTPGNGQKPVLLVHCWRGGMRSAAIAWLLDLYGFSVYTLAGGYKAYRQWVLGQFEHPYRFNILGGYTGSGKTPVLHALKEQGVCTIDLEALAHHKGSAFGALGEATQPRQEMFENRLATALAAHDPHTPVWLEDESQRIGNLCIPHPLWQLMRSSPVYFIDIPFEERLEYITEEYGRFTKEQLVNAIIRIQKRLGGLETKTAVNHLIEDDTKEAFRILLKYYDKGYAKSLANRENLSSLLNKIPCSGVDRDNNAQNVLHAAQISQKMV